MLNAYGLPRTRSLVSTNFGFYSSSRFSFRAWRDRRTNSHTPLKALSTRRRQSPAWVITKTQPVRCIAGTHPVKFWSIYFISIGRIYRVDFKAAFCDVPIGGRDVAILVCKRRRRSFGPRVMIPSESFLGVNKISFIALRIPPSSSLRPSARNKAINREICAADVRDDTIDRRCQ